MTHTVLRRVPAPVPQYYNVHTAGIILLLYYDVKNTARWAPDSTADTRLLRC